MINIKASKNWEKAKNQKRKSFVWDIDEVNRRVYNDISMSSGGIVPEKTKKKVNG